jgi:hypothetical protein
MFNCLEVEVKEVEVNEGMSFLVEKVRFGLNNDDGNRKKEFLYLPATLVSTNHSKFYLLEIKSKYENHSYYETIFKRDFHTKVSNNILKL